MGININNDEFKNSHDLIAVIITTKCFAGI